MMDNKTISRRLLAGLVSVSVLLVLSLAGGGVSVYQAHKRGAQVDRLSEENRELTEQTASLEKQMESLREELASLTGREEALESEKEALEGQLKEAQDKIAQLEQQLVSSGVIVNCQTKCNRN